MDKTWKGYTLDQMRSLRAQNKQLIRQERQNLINGGTAQPQALAQRSPTINGIAGAMNYVDYAIMTFDITKRIVSYLRNRRKR